MKQRTQLIVSTVFQMGLQYGIAISSLIRFCSYLTGEIEPSFNTTVFETKKDMTSYEIAYALHMDQYGNVPAGEWYKNYQQVPPPPR